MAPRPPPGALSSFIASPTLLPFHIQVSNYLSSHPSKHRILATALVFSPPNSTHVLIVQRSASDYIPHLWEVPGGSCDPDESILAGAVRKLCEESGLLDYSTNTSHTVYTVYIHASKGDNELVKPVHDALTNLLRN
jgi:8-oxo-dGTP pyrophosphatase MutT (NUDIX family)